MKRFLLVDFRSLLTTVLLCVTSFLTTCASAQSADPKQTQFLECKAKAEKGDPQAQCNLGVCYHNGDAVDQDHTEAVKWFRRAADQGNALAQFYLGSLRCGCMNL